ncbi:MAG: NADH dehydrogenase (quinone) subunit G [Acidobacteria bacterium]|nr:MAG: NADH dehydrogenase (quinone) subunit G [Acidobacteriota bacterium]
MADVHFTVNGKALTAPAGTLLIEACKQAHIEVPSFCYYPNLSLQAACRMCLVEIEKMPKLQTACTVVVTEGMNVNTDSETVHKARKSAIEFILTNHPLDCPVCDAGGECELQDMTFKYGAEKSRFVEPKRHREEQQWSPVVYFDRPRCILCYRCVRVCGEGMDVWALGVSNRGINATIIPNHQDHLECEECGNCIDICPVGALTSGAYRYQTRPWEMEHVGAICTFCGDGCKTTLGVRNDRVVRGDNRDKSGINGDFLCVKGRYGLDFTQHKDRLTQPLLRMGGELKPVSWAFALQTIAEKWKEIGKGNVGVIGSTRALNEEAYTLRKFAREVLGTPHLDHHRTADFPTLLSNAKSFATMSDLKTAPVVLLVGGNPTDEHPLVAWNIRWGYRLHKTRLYVLNRNEIKLRRQAYRYARVESEAAAIQFLNGKGKAAGAPLTGVGEASEKRWPQTPVSEPQTLDESLQDFRARLQQEQDVIMVISPDIAGDDLRQLIAFGNGLSGTTRYMLLGDNSNSRGASDMGLYPGEGGMNLEQMVNGSLPALYVAGANPFRLYPQTRDSLGQRFLVVQDLFLTETAQAADVVLPALSAYEKSGTITNTCGELQLQRRGGGFEGAKSDLEILYKLAIAMGADWGAANPERTLQEIRQQVPGYNVSLAKLMSGEAVLTGAGGKREEGKGGTLAPNHDTLFTAGTLGRYSATLNQVLERHLPDVTEAEEKTR